MARNLESLVTGLGDAAETLRAVARLHQCGVVDLTRPDRVVRMARENRIYGPPAALIMAGARYHPHRPAIADERGVLTYGELDAQSNALANALLAQGLTAGSVVGVLARDHRGLVLAISAAGRAGLRLAMMNTGFAKPQFAEVAARENVRAMLHDSEFGDLLDALPPTLPRILTWVDEGHAVPAGARTVDELIDAGDRRMPPAPARPGGFIILTSGTTGLPKGAPRTKVSPLASAMIADRIPFPRKGSVVIVSPIFHSTGFGTWTVATALGNKTVLLRRFDAEAALRAVSEHRAEMLVAVPTMLHRLVALGPEIIERYDLSTLKTVAVAGSALSPELATRVQDTFGDVLYNLYGSTEVAVATVAQPHELRLAPGTVGRPPVTSKIALFDDEGHRVSARNVSGRVFVRSGAPFEGYTDGRHKQFIDGHMSTGDMGRIDEHGLLHIDGRDDDMIVSGGENVYPLEIENLLAARPDIDEVSVVGVADEEFGKRLRAYIVPAPGATVDDAEIKAYVKANLARYKVPRDVVVLDELPRNATGKVLRRVLEEMD
ncbi:acyl-CoA synthetase [Nocardia nova]|uniref:acyl-CoA synthetase n=1 Tax=Nocardia nova TaxID=37330 RepID=UPI000CEA4298|nr:acyl-CoA synthetase [Nocardia nova]PPI99616.1 acyl-CoA synthetase [Nocardia nova]